MVVREIVERERRFRRRAQQSKRKRKGERQRGEIKLVGQTMWISDKEKLRERESMRDQKSRARDQESRARERESKRKRS